MVTHDDIGSAPVDRHFVGGFKSYTRNKSAAADNKPAHPVDVFKTFGLLLKVKPYWPNQHVKKSDAEPVELCMYLS